MRRLGAQRASFCLVFVIAFVGLLAGCGEPAPVRFGVLVADTGPAATYGPDIRNGVELAAEVINEQRAAAGERQVELVFRNTGTNVQTATIAAVELIENDGVFALLGPVSSNVALGLIPVVTERETILLSPTASTPRLTTEGGDYFFRVYPSDVVEANRMADFVRELAISRVAVVATEDIFGQGISEVFIDKYSAATREVVLNESIPSDLTTEQAREVAEKVKASEPEAVYIAAFEEDTARILLALDEVGCGCPRLATSAVTRQIAALAGESAEGLVFPQTYFDPADAAEDVQDFVERYQAKYGEKPSNYSAHAYDATMALAQAAEQAQIKQRLRPALLSLDMDGVTGTIDFNLQGDIIQAPKLYAVLEGEIVTYEQYRDARVGQSILAR